MNEQTAIQVAQQMANESQKEFVILKGGCGICQILSYENFKLYSKKAYYKKIIPQI